MAIEDGAVARLLPADCLSIQEVGATGESSVRCSPSQKWVGCATAVDEHQMLGAVAFRGGIRRAGRCGRVESVCSSGRWSAALGHHPTLPSREKHPRSMRRERGAGDACSRALDWNKIVANV